MSKSEKVRGGYEWWLWIQHRSLHPSIHHCISNDVNYIQLPSASYLDHIPIFIWWQYSCSSLLLPALIHMVVKYKMSHLGDHQLHIKANKSFCLGMQRAWSPWPELSFNRAHQNPACADLWNEHWFQTLFLVNRNNIISYSEWVKHCYIVIKSLLFYNL